LLETVARSARLNHFLLWKQCLSFLRKQESISPRVDPCFRRGDICDFRFPQHELIRGCHGLRIGPVLIDLVLVKKIVLLDEPGYQTNPVEDYFNKVHIG